MTTRKIKTKIEEVLNLINGTYSVDSDAYITTKKSLSKLSLHEIESLHIMIQTTV